MHIGNAKNISSCPGECRLNAGILGYENALDRW